MSPTYSSPSTSSYLASSSNSAYLPSTSSSMYSPSTSYSGSTYSPNFSASSPYSSPNQSLRLPTSSSSLYNSPNTNQTLSPNLSGGARASLTLPRSQNNTLTQPLTNSPLMGSPMMGGAGGSDYSLNTASPSVGGGNSLTLQALNAVDKAISTVDSNPSQVSNEIRNITVVVKQIVAKNMVPADLKQPIFLSLKAILEKNSALQAQPSSRLAKMHVTQQLQNLKNLLN
eukprot:CAMPEP_0201508420 /NCGR_PEP_ID=MMETSP0161_2-20130828/1799_1 /ASSEMBLY_ACC=CAM_ASM_000251 /TAXON_ID=180227 /ORGANISM="Neoparamoeba aestuarina, Strain SoJaBio B1-5/56/2" /LENGTH=227 /DNA_ID=CAMNT_0047903085 /DNA_START=445 /DNA_END=1125 /DNA_ORIENTATION=-